MLLHRVAREINANVTFLQTPGAILCIMADLPFPRNRTFGVGTDPVNMSLTFVHCPWMD